jgi:hypothetical protein
MQDIVNYLNKKLKFVIQNNKLFKINKTIKK